MEGSSSSTGWVESSPKRRKCFERRNDACSGDSCGRAGRGEGRTYSGHPSLDSSGGRWNPWVSADERGEQFLQRDRGKGGSVLVHVGGFCRDTCTLAQLLDGRELIDVSSFCSY